MTGNDVIINPSVKCMCSVVIVSLATDRTHLYTHNMCASDNDEIRTSAN